MSTVAQAAEPVKAIIVRKRGEGLTLSEFRRRLSEAEGLWREIPGVRRHVRSLTLDSGYRRKEPIYDVVDELWFDGEGAARAALESAAMTRARGDIAGSEGASDGPMSGGFLVRDLLAKAGPVPPDGVKCFEFVTRRADLSVDEFQSYWRDVHGPIAVHIEVIRRYVQCHTLHSEYEDGRIPLWDGTAITWFDDFESVRTSGASAELAATRADEKNFLAAPLQLPFLIVTERELGP